MCIIIDKNVHTSAKFSSYSLFILIHFSFLCTSFNYPFVFLSFYSLYLSSTRFAQSLYIFLSLSIHLPLAFLCLSISFFLYLFLSVFHQLSSVSLYLSLYLFVFPYWLLLILFPFIFHSHNIWLSRSGFLFDFCNCKTFKCLMLSFCFERRLHLCHCGHWRASVLFLLYLQWSCWHIELSLIFLPTAPFQS